ncbi:MAG: serine/threonine-protein kinase, partial [bacterium]
MAELSGRRLGDYILRSKIGDGGNGDVYRAEHRVLRRVAVVKVLNEERQGTDNAAVRFLREAQLASQLTHPNAAQVYDFGVADEDGLMWIAMEFVDGITLADWLEIHGPMSLAEAVQFFEPLAEVVDAAHQCGIVHRDLKPANVMVVVGKGLSSQGVPVPKLIDFGIAKGKPSSIVEDDEPVTVPPEDNKTTDLIRSKPAPRRRKRTKRFPPRLNPVKEHERRITPSGLGFGSLAYVSPEQSCNASNVGPAADIYSLGVMLHEALTGRLPFNSDGTDSTFQERD